MLDILLTYYHLILQERATVGMNISLSSIIYLILDFNWQHLLNEIAHNCFKIATNKSGCCVLQSCVENSHGDARKRLISEIIANAVHLAEDPYGYDSKSSLICFIEAQLLSRLLHPYHSYF